MKWYECESCWAEFRVVSDDSNQIQFCPFCGADIEDKEEELDEDHEDEE